MSIESLKQQARKHEQNEDWKKALDQYNKALAELARDEQVDIGLYNRVGDLYVRVGQLDQAVEHYEKAVVLYRDAYLPNNAIAVCKKIIRNVPERHKSYLEIGQIRAEQGFLPDARTNFLTYAERMQQDGDLDESFRALIEFCDLAPEDVGVRITVADQMAANGREPDAIEQLLIARSHLDQAGESAQAQELETKILALDPEADLDAVSPMAGMGSSVSDDGEVMADFGELSFGGDADEEEGAGFAIGGAMEEAAGDTDTSEVEVEIDAGLGGFEISSGEEESGIDEEEAVELPMMGFESEDDEDEVVELPMMGFDDEDDVVVGEELATVAFGEEDEGVEAAELPIMDVELPADDEPAEELPTMDFEDVAAEAASVEIAIEAAEGEDTAGVAAEVVEEAFEEASSDLGLTLAEPEETVEAVFEATIEPEQPAIEQPAVEQPTIEDVPAAFDEPVAVADEPVVEAEEAAPAPAAEEPADTGYVDFGAMILGDSEEKSTRFTVAYEEPSGDEDADFAKMLSQFKEKVSENLDSSDVRSHYDLGTAYKEMGLLDEAISSFQAALRASADHLPTYEVMGQTFMEMGQPEAAVKSLERALESASTVEDELVGIYYYLGRAYEELENKVSAVEYYDRVFSLDINFADVTERLRDLR
jgi:tetratricopeptide (TPR) repeat protein